MIFLTVLFLLLTIFDGYCTVKFYEHELNPFTNWLMGKFGVANGAFASVLIPAFPILALAHLFQWPVFLAFFTGMRTLLGLQQVYTLRAVTKR